MKTLSGAVGFFLLAVIAIAVILAIRPFVLATSTPTPTCAPVQIASCPPDEEKPPVLMIMDKDGVKSKKDSAALEAIFECLIQKCGDKVCNVDYYDKDHPVAGNPAWSHGHRKLVPTAAVRSEASRNLASADPAHLTQQVAFDSLDDATTFLSQIK